MIAPDVFASMCEHMNGDHADAVRSYARVHAKIGDAQRAVMTAMDASGMDLLVDTPAGPRTVRVEFDHTLSDAEDAKQTLIRLAM